VADLAQKMIQCHVDLHAEPGFAEKWEIPVTPSTVPAIVLMDGNETVLDILEKLPVEVVREAMAAVLNGDRPLPNFKSLEDKKDRSKQDYMLMAQYLKKREEIEKAVACLEKAQIAGEGTDSDRLQIDLELLECYSRTNAFDKAIGIADSLLGDSSILAPEKRPRIVLKKCALLYSKKDYDGALELLRLSSEEQGASDLGQSAGLLIGLCLLQQGKYDEALASFSAVGENAPKEIHSKSLYLQGYCHVLQREYDKAKERFSLLVERYPDSEYAERASSLFHTLTEK